MDNSKYFQKLRSMASEIADWNNIPTRSLYFDKSLNDEMQRLFGIPVYEEHKVVRSIVSENSRLADRFMEKSINNLLKENNEQDAARSFYSGGRIDSVLLDRGRVISPFQINLMQRPKPLYTFKQNTPPEIPKLEDRSVDKTITILKTENNERDAADAPNPTSSFYSRPRSASILLDVSEKVTLQSYSKVIRRPKPSYLFKKPVQLTSGSYSGSLKKQQFNPIFEKKRNTNSDASVGLSDGMPYRYLPPDTPTTGKCNPKSKRCCSYCYKNGMPPSIFTSHNMYDEVGAVSCLLLKKRSHLNCGASGSTTHSISYCPDKKIVEKL